MRGTRVKGRDGCLQRIWPRASASQACLDQSEPFANLLLIPQTPVLLLKKNRFALCVNPHTAAGVM